MRKFLSVALLSGLVLSGAYASDLLASVTNGAVSESSVGVHKLNTAEMANVKGGYTMSGTETFYRTSSFALVGKVIILSAQEKNARAIGRYGSRTPYKSSYAKSKYQELVSIANPYRDEHVAITASMLKIPTYIGIPRLQFSYGAKVVKKLTNGSYYIIRNASLKSYVVKDAMRHEKNNLVGALARGI